MLILGVSPLFAPTVGGVVAQTLGWQWVFIVLAMIAAAIFLFLPDGHTGDDSISLKPWPILKSFAGICRHPQFYTYALSGAFSLGGIFAYVAGSPILFMNVYHLSASAYSLVFAGLSIGFIGASQVNIALSRRFGSNRVFKIAIKAQAIAGLAFLVGTLNGWYGLTLTMITLFIFLCCTGFTYPNAAALALTPFHSEKAGRASALLGFFQVGTEALTSVAIGSFDTGQGLSVVAVMAATSWVGFLVLLIGRRKISKSLFIIFLR
jgi:DHA1 family bicyclomycin/chloramphenicol resistance-like MFS transporter